MGPGPVRNRALGRDDIERWALSYHFASFAASSALACACA